MGLIIFITSLTAFRCKSRCTCRRGGEVIPTCQSRETKW